MSCCAWIGDPVVSIGISFDLCIRYETPVLKTSFSYHDFLGDLPLELNLNLPSENFAT